MAHLRQLAHLQTYRPCEWDLRADAEGRAYWDRLFRWHLDEVLLPLIGEEYAPSSSRLATFQTDYLAVYDDVRAQPERYEPLNVLRLTELRRELLVRHGFEDPFRGIKRRENNDALQLLPDILAEQDAAAPAERQDLLALGLMAGNIFDLGAVATVNMHREGTPAFRHTRASQPSRPWFRDDVTAWWTRWLSSPPYEHAVLFVDNAGSDILLGILPLARWMLEKGARVTLAANSGPALNDITAAELAPLLERCADLDPALAVALADDKLRVVATGTRAPLLDLSKLSEACVAATADADLIMLHGMGRAIESNFDAEFRCDALWTAVLKDEAVAARLGGRVFDCVFRFQVIVG